MAFNTKTLSWISVAGIINYHNLIWAGLFASTTNLLYLSAIPSLFSYPYFLFKLVKERRFDQIKKPYHLSLLVFLAFAFLSGIFYDPLQFLEYEFYRFDGILFVSYGILLSVFLIRFEPKTCEKTLFFFSSFVVLSFWIFSDVLYDFSLLSTGDSFRKLFSSSAASAGFLGLFLSFVFFYPLAERNRKINLLLKLFFILSCAFFIYVTYSRGSLLGFFCALFSVFFTECETFLLKILPFVLFGAGLIILFFLSSGENSKYAKTLATSFDETISTFSKSKPANDSARNKFFWGKALMKPEESPWLGKGLGSYNDYSYVCSFDGLEKLYSFEEDGYRFLHSDDRECPIFEDIRHSKENYFNSEHAHNSYFQVFFELGLIGTALFFNLWFQIYRVVRENTGIYRKGMTCAFWFLIFSSFVENRLTAPSTILPFAMLLLVCADRENGKRKIPK